LIVCSSNKSQKSLGYDGQLNPLISYQEAFTMTIRTKCRLSPNRLFYAISIAAGLLLNMQSTSAQDIGEGIDLFNTTCAHCHGGNGQGGQLGPSILKRIAEENDLSLIDFLQVGNPLRGMPPVQLEMPRMYSLLEYLRFLSENVADASFATETSLNQYASMPRIDNFVPVTEEILLNPSPNDWLHYSRTYDAQRFSPLDQINTDNVKQLTLAWSRGMAPGLTETIPTVYNGVMYLTLPDSNVAALDATTGDLIWEYRREYASPGQAAGGRSKTMAIFDDMIYFTAPDAHVIALDAVTGELRWEAPVGNRGNTSGAIVVEGKVISGGTCAGNVRDNCFISAHDAYTGEELWRFYTAQGPDEFPGFDTWNGAPVQGRLASTWGLPGGYDKETGYVYWSVSNPMPNTRADRHGGDAMRTSLSSPSELFSNTTLALNPDTGEVVWYYQHLPGDDWDMDINQERTIIRSVLNPDPAHVKWINPDVEWGKVHDVVVNVGEGGGMWVLDKHTGQFLWATPFPEDVDNFILSDIDVRTGQAFINRELILDEPGKHSIICFFNTRSYWPTSYFPDKNALYVPYIRNCLNMTRAAPATETSPAMPESRIGIPQPGIDLDEMNGMARVNMETGEITFWPNGRIPTNSSVLTTAGNLIFWGDINRRFRAQHADTGEVLWETIVGGPISTSNITYSVNGKQYIAIITGDNLSHPGLNTGTMGPVRLNLRSGTGNNAVYVFALPD
jgi:PQQ-dependent dehydrogenase (methanol/ethanol family)